MYKSPHIYQTKKNMSPRAQSTELYNQHLAWLNLPINVPADKCMCACSAVSIPFSLPRLRSLASAALTVPYPSRHLDKPPHDTSANTMCSTFGSSGSTLRQALTAGTQTFGQLNGTFDRRQRPATVDNGHPFRVTRRNSEKVLLQSDDAHR